jgi:hypothetical protein
MSFDPRRMYLTHFGEIPANQALSTRLRESIDRLAATARNVQDLGEARPVELRTRVDALLLREAREHGVTLADDRIRELLAVDINLNSQGLEVWLARQEKRRER